MIQSDFRITETAGREEWEWDGRGVERGFSVR